MQHKMSKMTLDGLGIKIDSLREDIKEIKPDVKKNTKFRHEAKGFIAACSVIAGVIGGLISKIKWW